MLTISREYWFSSAHRLEGHPKCGRLHGHNYKLVVSLAGPLREGMVIDFAQMDVLIKPLVEKLDHMYLVSDENVLWGDPYFDAALENGHAVQLPIIRSTAECIAEWLLKSLTAALEGTDLRVASITLWETHKNVATVTS